jgi:hypothetical protein
VQVFTVTVQQGEEKAAEAFVRSLSPNAKLTYSLAGTCKFEMPCEDIKLSTVFERMKDAQSHGLTVFDWGVHNASLEDVFIGLAQSVAGEAALKVEK